MRERTLISQTCGSSRSSLRFMPHSEAAAHAQTMRPCHLSIGASLRVLEPAIDTGGPMGRMVLTVLGMVAEMELGFIRDRRRAGVDAAKVKGIYKGRPAAFDRPASSPYAGKEWERRTSPRP